MKLRLIPDEIASYHKTQSQVSFFCEGLDKNSKGAGEGAGVTAAVLRIKHRKASPNALEHLSVHV